MKTLRGKKALITGAASGIGRALALALAHEGVDLYLLDINTVGLADVVALAKQHGVEALGQYCNLAQPKEISARIRDMLAHWGRLDLLLNNAGIVWYGPTEQMTEEQWSRVLAVNLLAPIQITRELLPTLLAQEEAHILNVCSLAGLVAAGKLAAYNVTKFGLQGFSESLRAEYGRTGLGVTSLCPGFVKTNIYRAADAGEQMGKAPMPATWLMTTPERVAAKAINAIRKNKPLTVVTWLAHLLWFPKRLTPSLFLRLFTRKHRKRPPQTATAENPQSELAAPDQRRVAG